MSRKLSLRSRLLLAVGAIAFLALAVADVTIYTSLRSYLYRQADSMLSVSHLAVEAAAEGRNGPGADDGRPPGPPAPPIGGSFCAAGRESAPGMFIEVRGSDNNVVAGEECPAFAPGERPYSPVLPTKVSASSFTVGSLTPGGPEFRVLASNLPDGGVLIVADPIGNVSSTLGQLFFLELSVTIGALVGAVLLGLWLVRLGLRPLRDVVRTAESISGGDLVHRVPNATTRTEVGRVATAFNVMLERIESAFGELESSESRLRQFVADASHELRTPIAAVSAYAQLFKQGAAERDQDLPRLMSGVERETGRMALLVEDLLLLARFDERSLPDAAPVELVGLAAEAVAAARSIGPDWPITFVATAPVEVLGEHDALRRVIDNLLANARAHTPGGTAVRVVVGEEASRAFVEVSDDGPGLTQSQSAALFEPFVRLDPSRSRATGGAGLGLAVVASIVRAHGGEVSAGPREGGGARFTVVLPALAPSLVDEP